MDCVEYADRTSTMRPYALRYPGELDYKSLCVESVINDWEFTELRRDRSHTT